jgi:C-terminal processing protease CtpA/Prc
METVLIIEDDAAMLRGPEGSLICSNHKAEQSKVKMRIVLRNIALFAIFFVIGATFLPLDEVDATTHQIQKQEWLNLPNFYTENINSIPDLTQTDERANFQGGGTEYCCLVAIANSLMWLDSKGFPDLVENSGSQFDDEVRLVKLLGSKAYMDTSLDEGTGTTNIMRGLKKYIQDCGYEIDHLEYQGWRKHPEEMKTRYPVPQLDWLKQGILSKGSVWLNVGWYKYNPSKDEYQRIAGHWVTLVGYGKDEKNRIDPNILILHDPSPRAGKDFNNGYASAEIIGSGSLAGKWIGLPRSAVGYYKLGGGMHIKKETDTAIIDGAIGLKLKTKADSNETKQSNKDTREPIKTSEEKSGTEQVAEKLKTARAMLKGRDKNTSEAGKILLDLAKNYSASLSSVDCCYVYVYLGYIEDLAGNREGAIGWFKKACELDEAKKDGIYRVAEQGMDHPITWIRHLDGEAEKSDVLPKGQDDETNGIVARIGKGVVLKDEPKDVGVPKMNLSKAERLENFDILAEALDKNYSFFVHKNINWLDFTTKYRKKVETAVTDEEFYLLIYEFVRELKDFHSWLCNYKKVPDLGDFSPQMHTRLIGGKLVVTEVLKDSEAYANGLWVGAVITGIDGMSVKEKIEKNRPLTRMYSSERGFLEQAYRQILNGKEGSTVGVKFIAPGGNSAKTVRLKRLTSKKQETTEPNFPITKKKYIWDGVHPSSYGYIRILSFSGREEIADEFDVSLERLKNTPGLIIDVRENPGGFGTAQARIIGRLITSKTKVDIGYTKNGSGHEDFAMNQTYFEPAGNWQYTKPITLLTNAITGSACDLFVCRMVSTGRPIVVGAATHGNLTGRCVYVLLPCNLVVRISNGFICDASGRIIEENGNAPKIHVEPTIADVINGTDSVIERAVEELRSQVSNGNGLNNRR